MRERKKPKMKQPFKENTEEWIEQNAYDKQTEQLRIAKYRVIKLRLLTERLFEQKKIQEVN